jgi:hypothetical protein
VSNQVNFYHSGSSIHGVRSFLASSACSLPRLIGHFASGAPSGVAGISLPSYSNQVNFYHSGSSIHGVRSFLASSACSLPRLIGHFASGAPSGVAGISLPNYSNHNVT